MAGQGGTYTTEFLEQNQIRAGFTDKPEALTADVAAIREMIATERPEANQRQLHNSANQLYRYLHELKVGDRVLMYQRDVQTYHVAEVMTEARYDDVHALSFVRDVKWIGSIPRQDLSIAARNALGAILAFFAVNEDAQMEIERLLAGEKAPESESEATEVLEEQRAEVSEQAIEYIKDKLQSLDWDEMEELIAGLLRAMGYKTRVSNRGADKGKDIVASPDGFGLQEPRILVEVKHRRGQMGAPEIRSFIGGIRNGRGVFVSTGGFGKEARYEAERSDKPLTLVDVDELASMIIHYYDDFDPDARALLPLRKIYWPL